MSRFPTCLRLSKLVFDHKSCRTPMFKKLNVDRLSLTPYIQERGKLTWDGTFSLFSTASASSDTKPQEPTSGKTEQTIQENKNSTDSSLEELNKTLEAVTKQKEELDDKYKRALAESENIRKRLTKQIEDAKVYAIQSFCKDLLDVADVLSKATECVPKEEVKESNPHLKNLYEGLTMTEAQLHKVFQRHGLTPVNPLNEKFNPNLHEALFQQEVEGKDAGTVVVVSKIGYKLHERVVRPALVGVAKG